MRSWTVVTLPQQKSEWALLAALVIAIVISYGTFLRAGVTWGDDWATYIQDALNILHGNRYSATGYIVNPDIDVGPTAYPPLYSLMLSVPIALWGVDFHAIREFQMIFWGLFLVFVHLLSRRRLNVVQSFGIVTAVGLSPYFFMFKDFITSEVLFLALLYALFVVAAQIEENAADREISGGKGVLMGLLVALCIATRSIGIILVPAFVAYDLLRFRRVRFATIIAITIAAFCFGMQLLFVDFLKDYAGNVSLGTAVDARSSLRASSGPQHMLVGALAFVIHRVSSFITSFSQLWGQGDAGGWAQRIATIMLVPLALFGSSLAIRRKMMLCDVFAAMYVAAMLVLPPNMAGARMDMPLYPLFYIYLVMAVESQSGWLRRAGIAAILVVGLACYVQGYRNFNFRAPLEGFQTTNYEDMFDYIRTSTDPNSVIIFDKPRTLALYTHRRSAATYGTRKGDQLLNYMHAIGARYFLLYDPWLDGVSRDAYLHDFLRNHLGDFELVHQSGLYSLFRMKS